MSDLLALPGCRVLVTGGTQGIGAATARRFVEAGADVVVASRTPVEEVAGRFVPADVATVEGVDELARRTVELLGGVDVVVSNAGSQSYTPEGVLGVSEQDWRRDLDLNLLAAVRLDRALLPGMIAQGGGVILHVTSGQARLPGAASLPYAAAKAALTTYSKGLANEVGRHGIRVNTVVPGVLVTAATVRRAEQRAQQTGTDVDTALEQLLASMPVPLGRAGTADDAARLAVFLASPAAGYLTGSQYVVDGGLLPTV